MIQFSRRESLEEIAETIHEDAETRRVKKSLASLQDFTQVEQKANIPQTKAKEARLSLAG